MNVFCENMLNLIGCDPIGDFDVHIFQQVDEHQNLTTDNPSHNGSSTFCGSHAHVDQHERANLAEGIENFANLMLKSYASTLNFQMFFVD
jgi:hypothetical protein